MNTQSQNNKINLFNQQQITSDSIRNITFRIYYHQNLLTTFAMPQFSTVAALMQKTKSKLEGLNYQTNKILCLESRNNQEVLDYSLLLDHYPIYKYQDILELSIVPKSSVQSKSYISLQDFQFKKCLGQGASANVILVRHKQNGQLYALKQISKGYFTEFKRMEQVLRQKKIMTQFLRQSPYTARLIASFQSEDHLNFLLDFYPGGQMFYHLHKRRLTQKQARVYFSELIVTFQYLHSCNIIYRDLKPQNIMIDINGHTKLTDFGLCKINYGKDDLTTSYCGSIQYMAPQVKYSIGYSYSVDFYTLGAFLYELVMGVPPYYSSDILFFGQKNTSQYKKLVRMLVQEKVEDRVQSFEMIKNSQFMKGVNWNEIADGNQTMPFEVDPKETYIHDEFRGIQVSNSREDSSSKFDRLFNFFCYIEENDKKFSGCYEKIGRQISIKTINKDKKSYFQKKSESLSKRSRNSSRSSHKSQKKKKKDTNAIYYIKDSAKDSKKTARLFNKTPNLSQSKSAQNLVKIALGRI